MRGASRQVVLATALSMSLAFGLAKCATGDASTDNGATDGSTTQDDSGGGESGCGNTTTDPNNCGSCGHVCGTDTVCSQGSCTFGCTPPETQCGGDGGADFFDAGSAGGGDADAGAATDDGGGSVAAYCSDLTKDPANCGQCGLRCGVDHTCDGGTCTLSCSGTATACPSADKCIAPGTCCTNADCADAGGVCPTAGGPCGCPTTDTYGKTCATATTVSNNGTVTGVLPTTGDENWLSVMFTGNTAMSYHPHVVFTTNPGGAFAFDIQSSCTAGTQLTCPEGGNCTGKTDWEVKYTAGTPGPGFQAIPAVGTGGQIWIRVYRVSGTPSCDTFAIAISN